MLEHSMTLDSNLKLIVEGYKKIHVTNKIGGKSIAHSLLAWGSAGRGAES
jgi:hypothetical protein